MLKQSDVIKRILKAHPDYDVSETVWQGAKTKLQVKCAMGHVIEGFLDNIERNLCAKCAGRVLWTTEKLTEWFATEGFPKVSVKEITRISEFPGRPVTMVCKEHGESVRQYASISSSINSNRSPCKQCAAKNRKPRTAWDTLSFTTAVMERAPFNIIFTSTKYTGMKDKYDLDCDIHGPFQKTGSQLMDSSYCPNCGRVNGKRTAVRRNKL